jgi:HK97 family phage portal protein
MWSVAEGNTRALIPNDAPATTADPIPTDVDPVTPPAIIEGPATAADTGIMSTPPPQPWAGWPLEWATPNWHRHLGHLTDIAWYCLDLNSSILAAMPPYLVGAAPSLDAAWLVNPDPDRYNGWYEFARQLFWDFQGCGEAIVYATARYRSGWPARFHLIPPALVDIELDETGLRRYSLGGADITADVLHIPYQATTQDTRGHSALEVAADRMLAANLLARYLTNLMSAGAVPTTALIHPAELTAEQSAALQTQWVNARMSALGLPAVLSGGLDFRSTGMSPSDLALTDLAAWTEQKVAVALRVPAYLVGLPQSSDSLVYNTAAMTGDFHWRAHLRNLARPIVEALSGWALPTGTTIELNRDEYVKPGPLERAQTQAIYLDHDVLSNDEVREMERFGSAAPSETLTSGVLQ